MEQDRNRQKRLPAQILCVPSLVAAICIHTYIYKNASAFFFVICLRRAFSFASILPDVCACMYLLYLGCSPLTESNVKGHIHADTDAAQHKETIGAVAQGELSKITTKKDECAPSLQQACAPSAATERVSPPHIHDQTHRGQFTVGVGNHSNKSTFGSPFPLSFLLQPQEKQRKMLLFLTTCAQACVFCSKHFACPSRAHPLPPPYKQRREGEERLGDWWVSCLTHLCGGMRSGTGIAPPVSVPLVLMVLWKGSGGATLALLFFPV